jgi:hypothetical protein
VRTFAAFFPLAFVFVHWFRSDSRSGFRWLRRWVVGLFFGLLALLGVALHRHYGMGWDEPAERLNAFVSAKYVALRLAPGLVQHQPRLADIPDLHRHRDADHGVLFLLPLAVAEALWPGPDPAEWAYRRHLVGFWLFVAGAWALYRMGKSRFGNWRWGLVAACMLVLSPRLFAEAFYNYKDVVFLSLFTLALYTLTRWLRRPTAGRAVVHALATAAAIDVRTMGILLPVLTLGFAGLELWARPRQGRRLLGSAALYGPVLVAAVVLGWPYLWEAPLPNLSAALHSFSQYAKPLQVFYAGRFVDVHHLPWHYAPVWIGITTPLPYVLAFAVGLAGLAAGLVRSPLRWLRRTGHRRDLLLLAWFFGPLLTVIALRSAIYDGWRHLYFIYPAFVLLAVRGMRCLWQTAKHRAGQTRWPPAVARASLWALAAGTLPVLGRIVAEHPHQQVYFSFLPGPVVERSFERDYWGLSVKQGLEWVLAQDRRAAVKVAMDEATELTLQINRKMLPPAERERVVVVPPAEAEYFLTIYRWHPGPYPPQAGRPVHTIRVGGAAILTVLRRP